MSSTRVKVLAKAAKLLDALAANADCTVPALAQRVNEPRPTVYRLVQDLVAMGYVEEGPRPGTYRLGLELFRLGSLVALSFNVRDKASSVMTDIHSELEETVYLVIRRNDEAVCIERVEGLHIRSMALHLGGTLPLHLGAGPRALLAYQPREYWDEYFERTELKPMTPRTPLTKAGIIALLEEVRQLGYALSDEDVTMGITSVGAPILDHTGKIHAALSVGGLRAAVLGPGGGGERAVKLVREGAAEISRRMGYLQ
ncbi:MAG TPA: IclR family transcriptional regulator [Acidimicrobiales bacterium]|nr:IclR family transcriptional regulator [Acidimicrobiales bacterium]